MNATLIWLASSAALASAILLDMHHLKINRADLPRAGWVIVCLLGNLVAAAAYLACRRRVRQKAIDAAWQLIGDESIPTSQRRERLHSLQHSGLIGQSIFKTCMNEIERKPPVGSAANEIQPLSPSKKGMCDVEN